MASSLSGYLQIERCGGTGQMAIKEAAKRCTNYGLAGGPDAK